MKSKQFLFALLLAILVQNQYARDIHDTSQLDSTTLRLVHILHRHGDRSPVTAYTNDIYNESSWPQGYGQLSKVGMSQTHELGVFLRKRYIDTGFLSAEYKRTEVYVRSTDVDRTLMSAYCVLSGMYPPDKNQTWNQSIAWQPIPVHTVPVDNDKLLRLYDICPVFNQKAKEAHLKNWFVKDVMDKFEDEYKYISNHSGEPNTWEGIQKILDPLFCQYASGYRLPDWVDNHTMTTILQLRDLYNKARRRDITHYAYLTHGPLLGEIIDHMMNVSSGKNTLSQKFFEYSAHDTNVQGLLITMGVFNDRHPPYRSCIIIELHEPVKDKFVVKMLYRNESDHKPYPLKLKFLAKDMFLVKMLYRNKTDHEPYPLKLKDCDFLCPLETFHNILKSSIPTDIDRECGISTPDPSTLQKFVKSGPVAVIAGILTLILLLIVVIGAFLCCRHRDKIRESHDYLPVPLEMS